MNDKLNQLYDTMNTISINGNANIKRYAYCLNLVEEIYTLYNKELEKEKEKSE